ncbi:STAS-like domain-containing protein [Pseudomonas peli]|uniref:STAS-like domain-containing protein n=1 Tax=Pseudomonas peli TaxID=592361 RepID=UPI0024ADA9FB|nr:DUF4325 domain-containing protein [Pseudomonas peli]
MSIITIDIKDFSKTPYGRYQSDGPDNGETFRNKFLEPALRNPNINKIIVKLDSVQEGYEYGSSFLEESFGGLVRICKIPAKEVLDKIEIETKYEDYKIEIKTYIERAGK